MKLSVETLAILKNFSAINPSLYFKAGNVLSTRSTSGTILADAILSETFPQDFGIYDLNTFLSVISLYKDNAELEFDNSSVYIKGLNGRSKIKYRFANPNIFDIPSDKKRTMPPIDVEFVLTEEDFHWILRSANVLSCPDIAIESDGTSGTFITAFDVNNDSAHSNSLTLSDTICKPYKFIFKTDNLKLMPRKYDVSISSAGIARFCSVDQTLTYYIGLETSSYY